MNTSQRGFIEACEREQLHLSGKIQSHGAMIIADAAGKMTHISDNIQQLYGDVSPQDLGNGLPDLLWNLFRQFKGETCWFSDELIGEQGELDVVLSLIGRDLVGIEIMPGRESSALRSAVAVLPSTINDEQSLIECRQQLVDYIAELTGFERTMYYHFLPSGDGEVLA